MYICKYFIIIIILYRPALYFVDVSYQQVTKGAEMIQRALYIFWTFFIEYSVSLIIIYFSLYM